MQQFNTAHRIHRQVLELLHFLEGFFRRAFNPQENVKEIRLDHRLDEGRFAGQIHGGLGIEHHRVPQLPLPLLEFHTQIESMFVIADEIVVNNENLFLPTQAQ